MPYAGPDDPKLPEHVKALPAARRRQWVAVWQAAMDDCGQHANAEHCEHLAFAKANGVVKKAMTEAGDPVAANMPGSSDVHVPGLMGRRDEAKPPKPGRTFLARLRDLLRERFRDAGLTDEVYGECVAKARGHAGGMARAEQRRSAMMVEMEFKDSQHWQTQPRHPKGTPVGGEWAGGGLGSRASWAHPKEGTPRDHEADAGDIVARVRKGEMTVQQVIDEHTANEAKRKGYVAWNADDPHATPPVLTDRDQTEVDRLMQRGKVTKEALRQLGHVMTSQGKVPTGHEIWKSGTPAYFRPPRIPGMDPAPLRPGNVMRGRDGFYYRIYQGEVTRVVDVRPIATLPNGQPTLTMTGGAAEDELDQAIVYAEPDGADEPGHAACIVALWLAPDAAEALAVTGGEAAEDLHLTLVHLGESTPDLAARARTVVGAFALGATPFMGRVAGLGRFYASEGTDGKDCLHALIDSPELSDFRQTLVNAFTANGLTVSTDHGFSPHVTLAYVEPGAPGPGRTEARELAFTTIWVCAGDERSAFYLLGATDAEVAEAEAYGEQRAWLGWVRLGETADEVAARDRTYARLFLDLRDPATVAAAALDPAAYAEPPEWVPYLPRPGTYKHPRYGDLAMTRERNASFVDQFNAGIYQKQIPVDAEHETKLSGALGWITALRQNEDGSADARVDWTDRGRSLLEADRFKYVSPEFYDEWRDPATGTVYRDVAVGAAFTTRPFFKEGALRPLAASEGEAMSDTSTALAEWDTATVNDLPDSAFLHIKPGGKKDETGRTVPRDLRMFPYRGPGGDVDLPHLRNALARIPQANLAADLKASLTAQAQRLLAGQHSRAHEPATETTSDKEPIMSVTLTEEQAKQFAEQSKVLAEMQAKVAEQSKALAETTAAAEKSRQEATALAERLAKQEAEDRRRAFTAEIMGRSEANHLRWFGEPAPHLAMLEKLTDLCGPDSEPVRQYITQQRAVAEALKASDFSTDRGRRGSDGESATGGVEAEIERRAIALTESDPHLTPEQAFARVIETDPQLQARYQAERRAR